jgi:Ca2+-binding EF-hand superfamily protein
LLFSQLYGENGKIHRESLNRILRHFSRIPATKINQLFYSIDNESRGYITIDEFRENTENNQTFKKLYDPNKNFRQQNQSR